MARWRIKLGRVLYRWARGLYGLPMVSDPDWDACALCGEAGCEDGTVEHKPDCPSLTGVYPVTPGDVWPNGMMCARCYTELWPGDTYSLVKFDGDLEGVPAVEIACTGCAVLAGVQGGDNG